MSLDEDGFLDAGKTASGGPGPSMDVPLGTGVHDPLTGAVPPAHPVAQVMNVAFKAGALFFYLFGSLFALPFVFNFVVIVLCLAFDFWTVKNVTGRLLVGLRWWHEVQEDGSDRWVFESKAAGREVNPGDERVFWWALRISPIVWSTFFLVNLFSPSSYPSLPVLLMGAALSIANFIGYWRCDRDAKKKLQSFLVNRLV
ncbi:unnamed protein product (mitochondrion) [Plasmodiophora brassicae]|uniref:Golgi apparatus membrane protein TVP23 homolog n=1 Tax=Plasmodiophora brassicae TaxID=37360 RepID=A0A0G4ITB8_PLABS|nr:hypothetical protein PBRA_006455 [Plasmodiophora brassicae]SPQ94425.1 unnamed protein product [Plasmodiophora brassicae]